MSLEGIVFRFRGAVAAPILLLGAFVILPLGGQASAEVQVRWDAPTEIASGPAFQGPWRMNQSEFHYVDDPSVAMDAEGNLAVIWGNLAEQDLFFQSYTSDMEGRLAQSVNVSRSPSIFSWLPRIALGAEHGAPDKIYVLWQEIVFSGGSHGGEIFFARSTDAGRSFEVPINLSETRAGAGKGRLSAESWHNGSLDLVVTPDGILYAVWTEYEGRLWFSRSKDAGQSFEDPVRVGGDHAAPARGPSLAVDSAGVLHLAWTVGEDQQADIRYTRSEDGGRSFEPPRPVGVSDGHADAPKMAVDSADTVHLVYGQSAQGPGRAYQILYSRLPAGADDFEPPAPIPESVPENFTSASFPSLAIDAADNLYLTWELFPALGVRSQGLGFALSRDQGDSFTEPMVIPGSADPELGQNGSRQGLLMNKLAVGRDGGIAVVNSTFRSGERSSIWLHRGELIEPSESTR